MQGNNDLKFKTLQIANYLVDRFNQDINKEQFRLVVTKAYKDNGHKICFVNKKIYYDIHLLPEYEKNGKNKVCILGTYYFWLLDEKKTKNDYYVFFLEIINSLFRRQWEAIDVYGTAPQCIHEVNHLLSSFKQATLLGINNK